MPKEKPIEHKAISADPAWILKKDATKGIVEAIVSVTGVSDFHDDIIVEGAFKKTIGERGRKIKVLNHHNSYSVFDVLGLCMEMREIGREELPDLLLLQYPDATGALVTVTQYLIDTPEGLGAFKRIEAGAIDQYSIGFRCLQYEWKKMEDGRTVRLIKEVQLFEYSPVIWGANPATATVGTKSSDKKLTQLTDTAAALNEQAEGIVKAGRKISAANAKKLKAAVEASQAALDSLLSVMQEAGLAQDDTVEEEESDDAKSDSKSKTEQAGPSPTVETPTSDTSDTTAVDLKAKREAMLERIRQSKQES